MEVETLYEEDWKRARGSSIITTNNKNVNSVVRAVHWGEKTGGSRFHPLYYVFYASEDCIILTQLIQCIHCSTLYSVHNKGGFFVVHLIWELHTVAIPPISHDHSLSMGNSPMIKL
jgi:hypothetical protein